MQHDLTLKRKRILGMDTATAAFWSTVAAIGGNLMLGIVTQDYINLIVAISGGAVVVMGNISKIYLTVLEMKQAAKNKVASMRKKTAAAPKQTDNSENQTGHES